MKNSKGFTLVELIITISIIAIAGSVVATSLSHTASIVGEESANVISSLLSYTRVSTLSGKIEPFLEISVVDEKTYGTVYAQNGQGDYEQIHSEKIGDADVEFSHTDAAGVNTPITDTHSYTIAFLSNGTIKDPDDHKSISVITGYETLLIEITTSTGYHEIV